MLVAALLVGAVQEAPPRAVPATAVYAAFAEGCANLSDLDRTDAALVASGWQKAEPAADSPVGRLLERGREGARALGIEEERPSGAFRRTVEGQPLDLVLSGVVMDGEWINGCRVYVFDDATAIPAEVVSGALGRDPSESSDNEQAGVRRAEWTPGLRPDHLSVELLHLRAGSPVAEMLGFHGTALVAQASGRTSSDNHAPSAMEKRDR